MVCSNCKNKYLIRDGIPRMYIPDNEIIALSNNKIMQKIEWSYEFNNVRAMMKKKLMSFLDGKNLGVNTLIMNDGRELEFAYMKNLNAHANVKR